MLTTLIQQMCEALTGLAPAGFAEVIAQSCSTIIELLASLGL
jgi:hypothetical protein